MRATLIVLGILTFQLAVSIFIGKCIRAGRDPSVGAARKEHGPHRAEQDVDIKPGRPVADVVAV